MKNIDFEKIKPFVRYARELVISDSTEYSKIIAYDNRIFLCVGGKGSITVDGVTYQMRKGSLIMWRAGMCYGYSAEDENPMKLIGLNFDFTWEHSPIAAPIPPDDEDIFKEDKILENIYITDAECLNSVLYLHHMRHTERILDGIKEEFAGKRRYYAIACSCKLYELLTIIARASNIPEAVSGNSAKTEEILSYIQNNCHEDLSNTKLGKLFGHHPVYISRLINRATGISTHQYVISCRIDRAMDILQSGEANISETAYLCGFSDIAHFSKVFKQKTGLPPSAYRFKL